MPCNTPPPPPLLEDLDDIVEDDPNELEYEFLPDDLEELEENHQDNSILTFAHGDSVLCCNFDKSGSLAVSGGQDDKAFVWDAVNGDVKFECSGHTDSVISASFNFDDTLVATAGMDGIIQVWEVSSQTKIWSFESAEFTWLEWHPSENYLFAGTTDGTCWKWSVPLNEVCSCFPTNGIGTTCAKLFDSGKKCVICYMDGSIKVWDTEDISILGSVIGKEAHNSGINCVTCSQDGSLIATGSEDGTAKIIRSSNCRVLKTLQCSLTEEEMLESVESVGFLQGQIALLAVGTNDGNLRIFDVSTFVLRFLISVEESIVKLVCDALEPVVYVAFGGCIQKYDARSAQLDRAWVGHDNRILDFVLSKDNEKILSAADDSLCKIFSTR